jgi:hypothetical protein
LMGMVKRHCTHFFGVLGHQRMDLRQEAHSGVVEQSADDCGTFDKPAFD